MVKHSPVILLCWEITAMCRTAILKALFPLLIYCLQHQQPTLLPPFKMDAKWAKPLCTRITNTGNTPLNLTHDEYIPLVHVTNSPSVWQFTNQAGINNTVVYYNCSNAPGSTYPLVGNNVMNNNAPANTQRSGTQSIIYCLAIM